MRVNRNLTEKLKEDDSKLGPNGPHALQNTSEFCNIFFRTSFPHSEVSF